MGDCDDGDDLQHTAFAAAAAYKRWTSLPHENYSDASISLFRFRYDIDTILTKYRDIHIDI